MTDAAFGRLLYTDCAPGDGRSGGGGFQVQALSPQVDNEGAALATSWLLYEVQNPWVVAGRPVGDFPGGLAHAVGTGYGTGRSRYVGKEAVGGRQGNHLADCLLTRDAELYGTIRPAQLWGASFWRPDPWPEPDCPDFDGDLEPGPLLTLDELTGWARARSERGPVLARLLSVLEDPGGPRVVIVSAGPDEAMRWLASATLLLPQRRALDVTFKVFSANPLRAQQRVVAAPPDLYPQLRPGLVPGVFILDTAACQADETPASERAAFLAGKLVGDADPYDLLDALELADELSAGSWPTAAAALAAAWALTRPDDPLVDPDLVDAWLRSAEPGPLREHGPALVEMVLAAEPSAGLLRWLDDAVTGGRLDVGRETVRTRLLAAELANALRGTAPPAPLLPSVPFSDKAKRDAESELTSALLLGDAGQLDPGQFDLVLCLAYRHGISLEPVPAPLRDRLHAFAVAWIETSSRWDPRGRALADSVLDEAYGELQARFADPPARRQLMQALPKFGDLFDDRNDLAEPLYCHLQAAAIYGLKGKDGRLSRLSESLGKIARLPDRPEAAAAARSFQRALLDWNIVDPDVALTILTGLPSYVDPAIGERANTYLTKAETKPDAQFLDLLASLGANRWVPPSDRLRCLLHGELGVREFLAAAASPDIARSRARLNAAVEAIRGADPVVVELRAVPILDALLTTGNPYLAGAVFAAYRVDKGKPKPVETLIALIGRRLAAASAEESVSLGLTLALALASKPLQGDQPSRLKALKEMLAVYTRNQSDKAHQRWRDDVRARLAHYPGALPDWDKAFPPESPGQGGKVKNFLYKVTEK